MPFRYVSGTQVYDLPYKKVNLVLGTTRDGDIRELVNDLVCLDIAYGRALGDLAEARQRIRTLETESAFMLRLIEKHGFGEAG